ncbi:LysE family translocator [Xylella fastidiosa subsp. multiplex]|nr:LysE family translocator [Xylella fastidiosa]MDD0860764.1 LysE family translocator [Xylella fastidiosa subsp. multiplex]MDD0944554.1 LysE family translocator [Xylella fastidiosa subsp. multiplex]
MNFHHHFLQENAAMHGPSIYFILTVLMFSISPGPAMMFVLQQSQKNGVKTGLAAVLGTEIGVFIYVILTALGISTVLKQYPSIYTGLQGIGAAYLLYIAYLSWPRQNASNQTPTASRSSYTGTFMQGVLINLTNPKIVLFFLSLIPQFVPRDSNAMTFMVYGLIFNTSGLLVNFSAALLADRVNRMLRNVTWFNYVPPILFISIAVLSMKARL